jgi:hypothetical protein
MSVKENAEREHVFAVEWSRSDQVLIRTNGRALFLRPNHYIQRPGTKLIIQETGAPESCDDVASVDAYPWEDITGGAAAPGAGSDLSLLPQEAKMGSPITNNKIACGFLNICSST